MTAFLTTIPEGLWPIHLRPETGELLSSWLVRFAHAHGLRVESMCSLLFGRCSPVWNRDIDRSVPIEMLTNLSKASANDLHLLQQCTLQSFEGIISERVNCLGNTPGILPLGIYHRKRTRASLMFCPQCLRTDPYPFFRKAWRISWVVICGAHGLRLLDFCPKCSAPVVPHRADMKWRIQTSVGSDLHCCCNRCGFNLRFAQAPVATDEEIAAGRWIDHVLQFGWVSVGNSVVYGPPFFAGLSAVVSALNGKVRWSGLDLSPLEYRRDLISRACMLLQDWPSQFLQSSSTWNWTAVDLSLSRKCLPYWLQTVVKKTIEIKHAPISIGEARAIHDLTVARTGRFRLTDARALSGRMIEHKHLGEIDRRQVSDECFEILLAQIDYLISQQSNHLERCHLLADKVILALARVSNFRQSDIAGYLLPEAHAFASEDNPDFGHVPTTIEHVAAWVGWYLRDVRSSMSLPSQVSLVFVSRRDNRPLSATAFGNRFRNYIRDAGLQQDIPNFAWIRRRIYVAQPDCTDSSRIDQRIPLSGD